MSKELQDLIEKEALIQDAMKLQEYRSNSKFERLIDETLHELAVQTDDMTELTALYKFAEKLKERLQ